MTELTAGSTVAGLRIEGVLGRGGMGVVYRALDPELDRRVAVKVIAGDLAADPDFRRRFRRESRAAASVRHPNVIPIHRAGEEGGLLFLVMQHVTGTDLRELIDRSGRLAPDRVAAVVEQVGAALDAAHRGGLVHCDVKPANVLVDDSGDEPHAYLTDFGLTRQADASDRITRTGVLLGSFDYMAPELFDRSSASVASDVYALGCMAFHALSGSVPFPRPNLSAMIAAHLHAPPPGLGDAVPDAGLRAALDAVLARAMAKRPAGRHPSAGAFAAALTAALRSEGDALPAILPAEEVGVRRADPTLASPVPADTSPHPPPPAGPRFAPAGSATATAPTVPVARASVPDAERPTIPRARPAPPDPAPDPRPPPPPRPHRRARWIVVGALVALLAAVPLVAALLGVPPFGPGASPSPPPSIVLAPAEGEGRSVRLTWTGPDTLDYAVEVMPVGQPARTMLVGHVKDAALPVVPGEPTCVLVTGTDGRAIHRSNAQPVNGAVCGG